MNYTSKDKACGFCKANFEGEEYKRMRKFYDEFKDVIEYNSDL